jgi:SpoIIAA-like
MLHHELRRDEGILILRPEGPLEASDFERVALEVDPYIEEKGKLHGLMVDTESFPGWSDFGAFVSHLTFVRDHHRRIEKIAAVSDSGFLSIAPRIASHFVEAELRHFPYHEKEAALDWLRTTD